MSFPALLCLGRNYTLDLWLLQSLCINFFLNTWEWVGKDRLSELGFPVALGSPHLSSLGSMLHTWNESKEIALMLTDQIWGRDWADINLEDLLGHRQIMFRNAGV